ncbi:NCS1 family nucleobase:cation symporter-1 [Domibacillus indicus]|uniref:NCS1 family nucleobase:cation symporter-1 n=1 Tax=Domibacillus indicus TaxID=1437523 RepID=UPI000617DD82|nr:NCS1 family nucleobase:cation symporter-1 [Domibacillus indicus]
MEEKAKEKFTFDPGLYNEDLAPTPKDQRNWNWWSYSAMWMGIVHNLVAWEVAANLIRIGMSFWQALGVITLAYGVAFIAIMFNSVAGAKYGVPFPVLIRAAFGDKGAQVPVLLRALLAIFWFGVHMYIGSKAVDAVLSVAFPAWESLGEINVLGMGLNSFISFVVTWLLHAYVINHGIERVRRFELWAGPSIMVLAVGLVIWAVNIADGFSPLVSAPSQISGAEFWGTFFLSMSALLGTVATLILNISDLTRFSKSQKDHIIGQGIGLPLMFLIFSMMSILVASGTVIAFGEAITNPIDILLHFDNPVIVLVGAFSILISTVSVNVATNGISVGFDMTNLYPQKLNFSRSCMIAIIIGALSAPWLWYDNTNSIEAVMGAIGSTMGPVTGIMLVDFYFIRRKNYDVKSFYVRDGAYSYKDGYNKKAFAAFGIGVFAAFLGLIVPSLSFLYSYNWFLGVGVGGLSYFILMANNRSNLINTSDQKTTQEKTTIV